MRRSTSVGDGRLVRQLVKLPAHVRPTKGELDLLPSLGQRSVATIAVDLQDAGEVAQMRFGALRFTVSGINIGNHRRIIATPGPVIAGIGPQLAGLGPPAPGIEHWRGGLVGEQPLRSSQSVENVIAQRAQIPGGPANPVSKGGTIELDALPSVDLRLSVQRQVIGILGDQHLRDERFGGNAALNDPRWRRGLNNRALAGAAAVAWATRDQHAEGGWYDIEALGHVLADLMQGAAAARASLVLDIDDLLDPLQVCGQRAAVGLARAITPGLWRCRFAGSPGVTESRLDIFQAKLKLVGIELLGPRAEPMTHECVDDRLEPLDLGIGLALCERQLGCCDTFRRQYAGLFEGKRSERFDVFGKVRLHEHGSIESAVKSPVNRQFAGRSAVVHHARDASKAPSCAAVSRITPSWMPGHLKPPDSIFLAIRHRPVPSHQTSLIRSARLARNT